jgi:hypothetical protein
MSPLPVVDLALGRVEDVAHGDVGVLVRVLVLRLPVDRKDAARQREVNSRVEHPSPREVLVAELHDDVARDQAMARNLFELGRASSNELVEIGRVLESTKCDLQRRFHGPTVSKAHAVSGPSLYLAERRAPEAVRNTDGQPCSENGSARRHHVRRQQGRRAGREAGGCPS